MNAGGDVDLNNSTAIVQSDLGAGLRYVGDDDKFTYEALSERSRRKKRIDLPSVFQHCGLPWVKNGQLVTGWKRPQCNGFP
jgi:hypothetical protein